ncbi:MAG: DUF2254 domain-containing protein [Acidobacteriota bacterium]
MGDRLRFFLNRISERLWVRPLIMCVVSIVAAFLAQAADHTTIDRYVPQITEASIDSLLTIISASMLVIATFSLASMVSAYASASSTATPRSFSLVIADDVSQNALSTFIGAFIFSIVALIALQNGYYGKGARFTLFVLTLTVFAVVIITFVRWGDRIARLGRLGSTIDKVETATARALEHRRCAPTLRGVAITAAAPAGPAVASKTVGYVQRVDVGRLHAMADRWQTRIRVEALPGTFCDPGRPLASVLTRPAADGEIDVTSLADAFVIGGDRIFDEDPRFGLIVLSEIASRALSPAINDPGTAIDITGTLVRLFALWNTRTDARETGAPEYDRVEVPEVSVDDMFDDAFTAIGRDGAGTIEVAGRLQKALESLASLGEPAMRQAALRHARMARARAERAMDLPDDIELVQRLAAFAGAAPAPPTVSSQPSAGS